MTVQYISEKIEKGVNLLKKFGLNKNEALIYAYLLERGVECGGSNIALGAGIHRQYVYSNIENLINLGLIEAIWHGKQKKYKATSPEQIKKIAKRRVFEAEDVVRELSNFSTVGNEQEFEIFSGDIQVRNYEADFMNLLKEGETQYVISGASENFISYFGDAYKNLALHGRKKKLKTYYIGGDHEKEYLEYAQKINPDFKYKIIEGMPKGVTSTVMRDDSLILYSLAKPPLVYVIHSRIIFEEYRAYFDVLWKLAK